MNALCRVFIFTAYSLCIMLLQHLILTVVIIIILAAAFVVVVVVVVVLRTKSKVKSIVYKKKSYQRLIKNYSKNSVSRYTRHEEALTFVHLNIVRSNFFCAIVILAMRPRKQKSQQCDEE
jgi:hypothetical protein